MSSESEGEDYVHFGTPLEQESEGVRGFHKTPQDAAKTRALPVWKQEVTDTEGRKRFHGAFTGGYSAGFYNSVGSKEGFAPSSFRTSRSERSQMKKQSIEDFLDEDELEERNKTRLGAKSDYDTFASSEAHKAQRQAQEDASRRPVIPGPVIEELIKPVSESIGIKLLVKMGWRQGKGLGDALSAQEGSSKRKWGPEANVLAENVQLYKATPKTDLHGLGYDPFEGAEEFREARSRNSRKNVESGSKRRRGIAFGTGVLEETDQFGEVQDYALDDSKQKEAFNFEIVSDESDEEELRYGKRRRERDNVPRIAGQSRLSITSRAHDSMQSSFIPGFKKASTVMQMEVFPPPAVPPNFIPRHEFENSEKSSMPGIGKIPPSAQKPENPEVCKAVDTLAVFVARNGVSFENLAKEKQKTDSRFSFLFGGEGAEYYKWKLLDEKVKHQKNASRANPGQRVQPLTVNDRGQLLGESQLPVTSNVEQPKQEAARKPSSASRPYLQDIDESDRRMLKDVLKSNFVRGSTQEMIEKDEPKGGLRAPRSEPLSSKPSGKLFTESDLSRGVEFRTQGDPIDPKSDPSEQPVRTFEDWRPSPLLCKRFDVADPYGGKKSAASEAPKFQTYALQLPKTMGEDAKEETIAVETPHDQQEKVGDAAVEGVEIVERPIDLFKSIFENSDSEESEEEQEESEEMADDVKTQNKPEQKQTDAEQVASKPEQPQEATQHSKERQQEAMPVQKGLEEQEGSDVARSKKRKAREEEYHRKRSSVKKSDRKKREEKDKGAHSSDRTRKEAKVSENESVEYEVPHGLSTSELDKLLKVLKKDKKVKRKEKKRKKEKKERKGGRKDRNKGEKKSKGRKHKRHASSSSGSDSDSSV